MLGLRTCRICGQDKDLGQFYKYKDGSARNFCKPCWTKRTTEHQAARKARDPALFKRTATAKRHGLTLAQLDALWTKQHGQCSICLGRLDALGNGTAVDHDHKTDAVRGLLCFSCNVMLGHARDNVFILMAAVAYLQEHAAQVASDVKPV